jgi:predicted nuclease of restriction endonuclease-like (RecB) superfamily
LALTEEFGKGFSAPNLRNFRQFYLTYPDWNICYTLCSKLSWSHNRLIMRIENEKARDWYLEEAATQAWSVRVLERNINSLYYERLLSSTDKKEAAKETTALEKQSPQDFIKDPYIFEFLNIPQTHRISEADLETALIENLQQFLLELGKGFSFVGRQFRITTETKHFFIDLVFYNYLLKCFVLIDLKIGELTHQDTGQMDMYIHMFDDLKLSEGDNPTIGVILCSEKDETIVKYSIPKQNRQLFASKYRLYLPTEDELVAEIEREKLLLKEKFGEESHES